MLSLSSTEVADATGGKVCVSDAREGRDCVGSLGEVCFTFELLDFLLFPRLLPPLGFIFAHTKQSL